jgi:hypothetical protein
MTQRYLFGPIAADFARKNLCAPRVRGECLAFDLASGADLTIAPADTWEQVCTRLPQGWRPHFIVLWLPYAHVPACLWSAPVPLVGLAADWQLLWHGYRRLLRHVDLVLTDAMGVETLVQEGIAQASAANLYGSAPDFLEGPWPDGPKDIDVLFIGNFHPAIQRERLSWLGRLAKLAGRWRVELATGVFGDDYRQLLGRTRIVFNRAIRGECNQRVAEAVAAGALLFQEASNREVPHFLESGRDYVAYTEDNLEELLDHYLRHEEKRRAITEAARRKSRELTFPALWEIALAAIEENWPALEARRRARADKPFAEFLTGRIWQVLSSPGPLKMRDSARCFGRSSGLNGGRGARGRQDDQTRVPVRVRLQPVGSRADDPSRVSRSASYCCQVTPSTPGS